MTNIIQTSGGGADLWWICPSALLLLLVGALIWLLQYRQSQSPARLHGLATGLTLAVSALLLTAYLRSFLAIIHSIFSAGSTPVFGPTGPSLMQLISSGLPGLLLVSLALMAAYRLSKDRYYWTWALFALLLDALFSSICGSFLWAAFNHVWLSWSYLGILTLALGGLILLRYQVQQGNLRSQLTGSISQPLPGLTFWKICAVLIWQSGTFIPVLFALANLWPLSALLLGLLWWSGLLVLLAQSFLGRRPDTAGWRLFLGIDLVLVSAALVVLLVTTMGIRL